MMEFQYNFIITSKYPAFHEIVKKKSKILKIGTTFVLPIEMFQIIKTFLYLYVPCFTRDLTMVQNYKILGSTLWHFHQNRSQTGPLCSPSGTDVNPPTNRVMNVRTFRHVFDFVSILVR